MGTKAAEIQRWENKGSVPKTVWVRWRVALVSSRVPKRGGWTQIPWWECQAAEIGLILCVWGGRRFLNGERYSGDGG